MAINKLINMDKVNANITCSSPASSVAAPVSDRKKIINMGITNSLIAAEGKYNFINFATSQSFVDKLVEQIKEQGNIKSIAMFVAYQTSMQQTSNLLEAKLKEMGVEVVRENFLGNNTDFALTVGKTKRKDLDAWFVYASSPSADFFIREFFLQKVNKPLFAMDTYFLMKDPSILEGYTFVTGNDGDKSVFEKVSKKTASTNPFAVVYTYDAAKLLIKAYSDLYLKNNKIPNSDEVAEYLYNIKDYSGAIGDITVNEDGVLLSGAVVKVIKDGKPVTVE